MPILDHRDKIVRTLTLRQTWPRNMAVSRQQPKWQRLPTHAPFPSNVLYARPRSIDRTPPVMADPQMPDPHWSPPYPWAAFTVHQAINDWVEEQDLTVPASWFQLTIQAKKDYLAEHFG